MTWCTHCFAVNCLLQTKQFIHNNTSVHQAHMSYSHNFDDMDDFEDSRYMALARGGRPGSDDRGEPTAKALADANFANPIRGILEAAFPKRPVPLCVGRAAGSGLSSTSVAE